MPGLVLSLTDQGLELGGDVEIESVMWEHNLKVFVCEQQRPLVNAEEVRAAMNGLRDAGWEIEDPAKEASDRP